MKQTINEEIVIDDINGKLSELDDDEMLLAYELLAKLGLGSTIKREVKKRSMESAVWKALPAEYDLMVTIKCATCSTNEDLYFRMTQDLTQWGLVAIPITPKPDILRRRTEIVDSCRNCLTILSRKSQQELIDLIFWIINRYRLKLSKLIDFG
jgi:hypothetical protein